MKSITIIIRSCKKLRGIYIPHNFIIKLERYIVVVVVNEKRRGKFPRNEPHDEARHSF